MALCGCGCGELVTRRGRTGPAPTYASHACRQRAYAARQGLQQLEPIDDPAVAVVSMTSAPASAQVEQAIVQARAAAFALKRLGRTTPATLAWRCQEASGRIMAALVDAFGDGVA